MPWILNIYASFIAIQTIKRTINTLLTMKKHSRRIIASFINSVKFIPLYFIMFYLKKF